MSPVGVIRPMLLTSNSVNQRLPSGPVVIELNSLAGCGNRNLGDNAARSDPTYRVGWICLDEPQVAIWAHGDFSGIGTASVEVELGNDPGRRDLRDLVTVGFTEPEVAIWPGDDPLGALFGVGMGISTKVPPSGVSRPTLLPPNSVNQRLPSGPVVIPKGALDGVGRDEFGDRATGGDSPDYCRP